MNGTNARISVGNALLVLCGLIGGPAEAGELGAAGLFEVVPRKHVDTVAFKAPEPKDELYKGVRFACVAPDVKWVVLAYAHPPTGRLFECPVWVSVSTGAQREFDLPRKSRPDCSLTWDALSLHGGEYLVVAPRGDAANGHVWDMASWKKVCDIPAGFALPFNKRRGVVLTRPNKEVWIHPNVLQGHPYALKAQAHGMDRGLARPMGDRLIFEGKCVPPGKLVSERRLLLYSLPGLNRLTQRTISDDLTKQIAQTGSRRFAYPQEEPGRWAVARLKDGTVCFTLDAERGLQSVLGGVAYVDETGCFVCEERTADNRSRLCAFSIRSGKREVSALLGQGSENMYEGAVQINETWAMFTWKKALSKNTPYTFVLTPYRLPNLARGRSIILPGELVNNFALCDGHVIWLEDFDRLHVARLSEEALWPDVADKEESK